MSSEHVIYVMAVAASLTVREDTLGLSATCTEPARELVSGLESRFNAHVSYDVIGGQCHIVISVVLLPLFWGIVHGKFTIVDKRNDLENECILKLHRKPWYKCRILTTIDQYCVLLPLCLKVIVLLGLTLIHIPYINGLSHRRQHIKFTFISYELLVTPASAHAIYHIYFLI